MQEVPDVSAAGGLGGPVVDDVEVEGEVEGVELITDIRQLALKYEYLRKRVEAIEMGSKSEEKLSRKKGDTLDETVNE